MTVYEYMRMRIDEADGNARRFADVKDMRMYTFWSGVATEFKKRLDGMSLEQLEMVV